MKRNRPNDCAVSEAEIRDVVRLKHARGAGPVWLPRRVWEERVLLSTTLPPEDHWDYEPLDDPETW